PNHAKLKSKSGARLLTFPIHTATVPSPKHRNETAISIPEGNTQFNPERIEEQNQFVTNRFKQLTHHRPTRPPSRSSLLTPKFFFITTTSKQNIPKTPKSHNNQAKMFRFSKTLDPITLFHAPTLQASTRALNILKQASATASETATEDQASDYARHAKVQRGEFELEVTTSPPTVDQLRSILDYVSPVSGAGGLGEKNTYGVGELIKGARDAEDALKKFKEDNSSFVRPITVDWVNGRAVIGDNESEILRMVRQLPEN
ncbi:uncharacterized protein N7515_002351, partial [Penicillium bovifimosum]